MLGQLSPCFSDALRGLLCNGEVVVDEPPEFGNNPRLESHQIRFENSRIVSSSSFSYPTDQKLAKNFKDMVKISLIPRYGVEICIVGYIL